MHNAAFAAKERNCAYLALKVAPRDLPAAVAGLRALPFKGFNVTIPHKETILDLLDEVAPLAKKVGAVNTVVKRDDRLWGYNTDVPGFYASLEETGFSPAGKRAVLLGAGGAARAVLAAIAASGVATVAVLCRRPEQGKNLIDLFPDLKVFPLDSQAVAEALAGAELVVNATSVGMYPRTAESLLQEGDFSGVAPACLVVDLVYNPLDTALLQAARGAGLPVLSGGAMLVHQGALAWKAWFEEVGPVEVMGRELGRRLGKGPLVNGGQHGFEQDTEPTSGGEFEAKTRVNTGQGGRAAVPTV